MARATFRNKDSRMIRKAGKLLVSILARDQLAILVQAGTKTTTTLSTRTLIFDNNNTPGGLLYEVNAVLQQLLIDVYLPGTVPGGVTPAMVFGPNPIKIVRS